MSTWYNDLSYETLTDEIYTTLEDNQVSFFMFNDKCYIMDGTSYLVYDGETVEEVVPYIPTISISKTPTGGGTPYEDFNLLGSGFKDSFSSDGIATEFQLSLTDLDADSVTAVVDNVEKFEGENLTVDRVTGKVTFNLPPFEGTNNVVITAYKAIPGNPEKIKKCRFHTQFGGANDTRIFLSGNPDMPDYIWRLGLQDPTYAPENGFYKFNDVVMGFSKQYDYLVVHRKNGYHQITFEQTDTGSSFPSKPLNDQVGTLATKSIQIVENNPVALSKNGVYMMTASSVRDERNVTHISNKVDAKLLREPNLDKAVSFDFDRKYWLCVNGNVYVYDYSIGEWYLFDNVRVSNFIEINGDLYFGSADQGILYRFKREDDTYPYNDDGETINAHWKSKYLTFNADERRKLVEKVFYSMKPTPRTSADLYYVSDKKKSDLIKTNRMDIFNFSQIDFDKFTFLTSQFPQEVTTKIKAKKITHFQLEIKNNKMDESLGVLSLGIKYNYQSHVK